MIFYKCKTIVKQKGELGMLYFAYGSNLNVERLKGRCPSAQKIAEGVLRGYKLGFQNNDSGRIVANIIESQEDSVKGILYHIADAERRILDSCEGHPIVYKRIKVNIDIEGAGMIECETYIMEQTYRKEHFVPFDINKDRYKGIFKKKATYIPVYEEVEREYGIPNFNYLYHILKGYGEMTNAEVGEIWDIFKREEYKEFISKIKENVSNINKDRIIFVYGSLKKGFYNHNIYLEDVEYIGTGVIDGYDMYSLGKFPAIVEGNGVVYGELYKVTEEELSAIDMLEGYNPLTDTGLYIRRTVEVQTIAGKVLAEVYVWGRGADDLINKSSPVLDGNWTVKK